MTTQTQLKPAKRLSSQEKSEFLERLRLVCSNEHVATDPNKTKHYREGFRSGSGDALAVIFPTSLVVQWQVLEICVEFDVVMIMQAANTGLTEGSTPNGNDYDRDVVVINTTKLTGLQVINDGNQVISFPGTTLHTLEKTLRPLKRAPHSVIGSSCIGASIVGGVANNSGGALVKRGPAYTELSLYAQIDDCGKLSLVNHLGIDLGNDPQEILDRLENGNFSNSDIVNDDKLASDKEYLQRVREVDEDTPARYNADKRRLHEVSGCAGKLAIFAVRLDTYPIPESEQVFYIGTNDPDVLTDLRRSVLTQFKHLPEVAEYMHREAFDIADKYGKDVFLAIGKLGTDSIPKMFAAKAKWTSWLNAIPLFPKNFPDKFMQYASKLFPSHLPTRMVQFRNQYEHHLIFKASDEGIEESRAFFEQFFKDTERGGYFECTADEGKKAMLHRFAAAGAAIRYEVMHQDKVEDILALDIALRRNDKDWVEKLPESITSKLHSSLYYGHFFCHVFHQDYIVKKGEDVKAIKKQMLELLEQRGAKYPAEHNVGHLYKAEADLANHYITLDPTNTFNPGVGKLEKTKRVTKCGCLDHQLKQKAS